MCTLRCGWLCIDGMRDLYYGYSIVSILYLHAPKKFASATFSVLSCRPWFNINRLVYSSSLFDHRHFESVQRMKIYHQPQKENRKKKKIVDDVTACCIIKVIETLS
jgi:hypothetical protein